MPSYKKPKVEDGVYFMFQGNEFWIQDDKNWYLIKKEKSINEEKEKVYKILNVITDL